MKKYTLSKYCNPLLIILSAFFFLSFHPLLFLELKGDETILEVNAGYKDFFYKLKMLGFEKNTTSIDVGSLNLSLSGCFDVSICYQTLHWLPDSHEVYKNLLTCLKHNGKSLIISYSPNSELVKLIIKTLQDLNIEPHLLPKPLDVSQYKKIYQDHNHRLLYSNIQRQVLVYRSKYELYNDSFRYISPFLPKESVDLFCQKFIENAQIYLDNNKYIIFHINNILLTQNNSFTD